MASIFQQRPPSAESPFRRKLAPAPARPAHTRAAHLWALARKHALLFMLVPTVLSLYLTFTTKSRKVVARSVVTFQVNNIVQAGLVPKADIPGLVGEPQGLREKNLAYLKSHEFFREAATALLADKQQADVVETLKSNPHYHVSKGFAWPGTKRPPRARVDVLTEQLRAITTVSPNGEDNVQFEVQAHERALSLKLADSLAHLSMKLLQRHQMQNLANARENVTAQMDAVEKEVGGLGEEILSFKKKHNLVSTETLPEDIRTSITNLNKSVLETEIQLKENAFLMEELTTKGHEQSITIVQANGVSYADQVLAGKLTELREQRVVLESKLRGLRKVLAKELEKYDFVAEGEEHIGLVKNKLKSKFELLTALEQRMKDLESINAQIQQSIRPMGEAFLIQSRSGLPLSVKLVLSNLAALFLLSMGLFYWYEAFPVVSSRDSGVMELSPESLPLLRAKGKDASLAQTAGGLSALQLQRRLWGPGMYQVLSADRGDGKSFLTTLLANNYVRDGKNVAVVDFGGGTHYQGLDSRVRVISDPAMREKLLQDPTAGRRTLKDFDYVLVDGGALERRVEHLLVSPAMDGIIFVGTHLRTRKERFLDWQAKINHIAGNKAVYVVNKTPLKSELPFLLSAASPAQAETKQRMVS